MEPAREVAGLSDRLPPHSREAEQAVLGAMMLERDAIARVAGMLRRDDFYWEAHKVIFDAVTALFDRGVPVDIRTVGLHLQDQSLLEASGGHPYLVTLYDAVPTATNVEHYARVVLDRSVRRQLINASHQVMSLAHETSRDTESVVDAAEQVVFEAGQRTVGEGFVPLKPLIRQAFDDLQSLRDKESPVTGLPSGFVAIDQITCGFQAGDLIILAGRPSMGKTALALNIAAHVSIRERRPVAFFSLETSKEQLALRLLCSESRVDMYALRQGMASDEEAERLVHGSALLYDAAIYVDDGPDITTLKMKGRIRRLMAEVQDLGMVVVDYLQLVRGEGRFENRTQEISQVARGLKALAKEMRVPVIALSQLSRRVEEREPKRPLLSDLRESGSIEAEADVVFFVYRPAYYGKQELIRAGYGELDTAMAEIIVAKHRNGPTGTAPLTWTGRHIRFDPLEEYRAPDYAE
jgi:replicative DNA helicase